MEKFKMPNKLKIPEPKKIIENIFHKQMLKNSKI